MANADDFIGLQTPGRVWDWFWVPFVFGVVWLLFALWPFPGIHPSVWEDAAIASGLRPPGAPFPGLYRGVLAVLFKFGTPATAFTALSYLGRICIGLSAVFVYLVFRDILPAALRLRVHMSRVGMWLGRIIAILVAILFTCAEPVWRAGQTFSPVSLFLLLVTGAGCLFFVFLRRGSIWSLYFCFALIGFISVESTLGFLMLILAMVVMLRAVKWANNPQVPLVTPIVDELVRVVVFKRISYIWLACFVCGVTVNVIQFVRANGLEATGHEGVLGLLFEYFRGAWDASWSAATGPGWLFMLLFSIAPFVFLVSILPKAWDDDKFLPWGVGMCSGFAGVVALSQLVGTPVLWFWTWLGTARETVSSDILLSFVLLFNVATVAFALAIFGVDAYCRNYRRIAHQRYPESMLSKGPALMAESLGRARVWRQRIFALLIVAIPFLVVPGRVQLLTRSVARTIQDAVEETLAETKNCDTIFTDGSYDPILELEALRRGRPLVCLSFMAPNNPRERMLRDRAAKTDEDRALFENDAPTALRAWVENSDASRLTNVAVQIGFEMWKRVKKPLPPLSGLVALPGGVTEEERARALAACEALGKRAGGLSRLGKEKDDDLGRVDLMTDAMLRRKFPFVLWRLSRLAQMRSRMADVDGNRGEALREASTADMLDRANSSVRKMRQNLNWLKMQNGDELTPREGLIIGLSRADFAYAGRFAAPILAADPDEPRANFAMGMLYFQEEKYSLAEEHLKRCLLRRPDEPAVLNNLALIENRLGKHADAERHVRRALEKYPDLPELAQTLESIKKAKAKAEAEAAAAAAATKKEVKP